MINRNSLGMERGNCTGGMCVFHGGSVGGNILSPPARDYGAITQCQVLVVRTRVCRTGGALARRLFAQPRLYVIYRLKERGTVVQIVEEIGVGIRAYDGAADDATGGSDGSQGRDATYGERRPTDELAEYEDGEGADDASSDLRSRKGWVRWVRDVRMKERTE